MSNGTGTERTKVDPVWLAIAFFVMNFLFTLGVLFTSGYAVNDLQELVAKHAEQARRVEERIGAIEETFGLMRRSQEIDSMQILSLGLELKAFRRQVHALEFGTYVAEAYSSLDSGRGVCFDAPPQDLETSVCTSFGTQPSQSLLPVVLYDTGTGKVLDMIVLTETGTGYGLENMFDVWLPVAPGDYVVAWYATTEEVDEFGTPVSPVYGWQPYFWDKESGLAVAVVTLSGVIQRP